jgi:flagellar basal-body rod modification protein FlgD
MSGLSDVNAFAAAAQQGAAPAAGGKKDRKEAETAPQFGDVLKKMQGQYGAKAEKQREIKKTLGKDDFLRIMITQMKQQDPTNPFKAEQMAAEMAQFTSVEQLQNMNQSLKKMSGQSSPADRMAMTGLIGKMVTVDKDRFPHAEGENESLTFNLPKEAKEAHVALVSETGEVVFEKDIGSQKKGEGLFAWDGLKTNNLPAKAGNYILRIEAKDEGGNAIQTDSRAKSRVVGVSFEGGEPLLLVGDAKNQSKITLKNIVKIESEGQAVTGAGSTPEPAVAENKPGFVAFKKGEGSAEFDPNAISPAAAAAIAKYSQPQAQAQAQAPTLLDGASHENKGEDKGFPNGLQN